MAYLNYTLYIYRQMRYLSIFTLFFCISIAHAQVKPALREKATPPGNPKKFWLFLLAGQSNMAGRGPVEAIDTIPNARVYTLNKNGEWEIAKDPIHFDKDIAAVGPGLSFGKAMAEADNSVIIGLIPCAVGGSAISSWNPGDKQTPAGKNYQQAIERCRKAMPDGVLKGIVWNQGETDCTEKASVTYQQKLKDVIEGFRRDLANPKLVFLAAELPDFQKQQPDKNHHLQNNPYVDKVNMAITQLKGIVPNYDYITPEGTDHKGDHLHYNAASARLMGKRYAVLMLRILKAK
jgi:hypothetical protein